MGWWALILVAGVLFKLMGLGELVREEAGRRWAAFRDARARKAWEPHRRVSPLLGVSMPPARSFRVWAALALAGALIFAITLPWALLRGADDRAVSAQTQAQGAEIRGRTAAAEADLARQQTVRVETLNHDRQDTAARVAAGRAELERMVRSRPPAPSGLAPVAGADPAPPPPPRVADRGGELVRELRDEAARRRQRALDAYRRANPDDAGPAA